MIRGLSWSCSFHLFVDIDSIPLFILPSKVDTFFNLFSYGILTFGQVCVLTLLVWLLFASWLKVSVYKRVTYFTRLYLQGGTAKMPRTLNQFLFLWSPVIYVLKFTEPNLLQFNISEHLKVLLCPTIM